MPEQEIDKKKKPISFLQAFFEDRNTPALYRQVSENVTGKTIFERKEFKSKESLKNLYSLTDIPGYLDLSLGQQFAHYKTCKCDLFDGFLVDLTPYTGVEAYLKDNFGKTGRSKIRRYIKRLELCT